MKKYKFLPFFVVIQIIVSILREYRLISREVYIVSLVILIILEVIGLFYYVRKK